MQNEWLVKEGKYFARNHKWNVYQQVEYMLQIQLKEGNFDRSDSIMTVETADIDQQIVSC